MEVTLVFFLECVYLSLLYPSFAFDIFFSLCWSGFRFHLRLFFPFKELQTTLNQRRYMTTLINKGLDLEKIPQGELRNPKKHNNEKPLTYVATYNKIYPELFTEIMKNLEELKNKDKIKEILDTTKIIKSQRQPKNLKRILTSSTFGENTTLKDLSNAKINDVKYVIELQNVKS